MLQHAIAERVLVSGIYNHEFPRRCFASSVDPSLMLTSVSPKILEDFLFLIPLLVPSLLWCLNSVWRFLVTWFHHKSEKRAIGIFSGIVRRK